MSEKYPKRLTEIWKTSDGQMFETQSEALQHERKIHIKTRFKRAWSKAHRQGYEMYGRIDRDLLFNILIEEGMDFIVE